MLLGRADDCFKSKGVLIVPREVEEAILGLGTFEEACVFPLPDGMIGNRVAAAVVLRGNVTHDPINAYQHADAPYLLALLRARREQPHSRAAEQRDELAAPHSITSSAATCRVSGTLRPSVLAVLRLIHRSNFWTG